MLATNRIILRRFLPDDGPDLFEYLSDPEVARFEPYAPFTLEQALKETARRANDSCFYAVCLRSPDSKQTDSTQKLIGNLWFSPCEENEYELGFVFNRAFWGKGYAYESSLALLRDAFSSLPVRCVTALCNIENLSSQRLLERLGFTSDGSVRQSLWFGKNAAGLPYMDSSYTYTLFPGDLPGDSI